MPYTGFGTSSPLSGAEVSAIELAVRVSGQGAVTDLEASLRNVTQKIDQFRAALASNVIATEEFVERTKDLFAQQTHLEASIKAANNAMTGTTNKFSNTGQAALQLSYALDDLQYGFSAIVNNAPQIALAMGGGPGLAGAMGVAFVAANILTKHLPDLSTQFTQLGRSLDLVRDPIRDTKAGLEGMQEVVQALTDKPYKVQVDFVNIREMTREIERATRAKAEFDAINKKRSEMEEAAHKAISEGIVEAGGGAHRLEDALIEIAKQRGTYGAGTEEGAQITAYREIIARADKVFQAQGPGTREGMQAATAIANALEKMGILEEKIRAQAEQQIADMLDLKQGEGSRKALEDLVNAPENQAIFERRGIDVLRLAGGVGAARPEFIREQERKKAEKKAAADLKQRRQEIDADLKARTGEAARAVGPGVDDALQKAIFDAIQGGATPEAAMKAQRPGLVGTIRGRGVGEDVVSDAANLILQKAADSALNLIGEGGRPKIDVTAQRQAEAEGVWQIMQDRRITLEQARAQKKAAAERKKQVDALDQGFTERAAALMAENDLKLAQNRAAMAQGMPAPFPIARNAKEEQNLRVMGQPYALRPEVVGRDVQRRIAFDLGRTGQDVGLAPDITARGAELYRTRATEAQARTPMPDVSALAAALGAGQAQAVGMQAQAIQALADTFAGLQGGVNRNLQQSGRALQGVMGVQGNANRGRMHKGSNLIPFSAMY